MAMAGTSVTALSPDKRRRTMHLGIFMGAVDTAIEWSDVFLGSLIIGLGLAKLCFPRSDLLTGLFGASSIYGVRLVAGPVRAASGHGRSATRTGLCPRGRTDSQFRDSSRNREREST